MFIKELIMMKYNIIFLDIDGVCNTDTSYQQYLYNFYGVDSAKDVNKEVKHVKKLNNSFMPKLNLEYWPMDQNAINNIHRLLREVPNLKFVISSSWKTLGSIEKIQKIFQLKGLNIPILDKTSSLVNRGFEIKDWLDKNALIINKYCVIDDNTFYIKEIIPNELIVTVNPNIGYSSTDFEKTIKIFE
jgi:hypothetical protein